MSLALLFLVLMLSSQVVFASGSQSNDSVKTNLELFRDGISALTDSIFEGLPSDERASVVVSGQFTDEQLFVRQAIVSRLKEKGTKVYLDKADNSLSSSEIEIVSPEVQVKYGESFRESFLGETKTTRSVSVVIPFLTKDVQSNFVIESRTLTYNYSDTISTDFIPSLEQTEFPCTHAPMPERDFFDHLLEPIIIIGATGVAVYLFFHVRS